MPGLMSGDWKRSTVSGPQRLQPYAWTAPDLSATAPAPDSTPRLGGRLPPPPAVTILRQVIIFKASQKDGCARQMLGLPEEGREWVG